MTLRWIRSWTAGSRAERRTPRPAGSGWPDTERAHLPIEVATFQTKRIGGATDVAVPAHLANRLQLRAGRQGLASTANGVVRVAESTIDTLRIGEIVVRDVKANLNPGMQDDHILLGMSVLRQLEFTQRGDWLILRTL